MAYRILKKTTKNTVNKCLDCKYCKEINSDKIECTAENTSFSRIFNPRDFCCIEYKGFDEITDVAKKKMQEEIIKKKSDKEFSKYVKTYFTKSEAKKMIKERKLSK